MTLILMTAVVCVRAQTAAVYGTVSEAGSGKPIAGAVLSIGDDYLWTVADNEGRYVFDKVQKGEHVITASCLGYVSASITIDIEKDIADLNFILHESSLALDEVVVTAQKAKDGLNTSHSLGRDALNHLQLLNMTDVAALLPGGKTSNPDLTEKNAFSIREGGSADGNASFGTAVEVDGVDHDHRSVFSVGAVPPFH